MKDNKCFLKQKLKKYIYLWKISENMVERAKIVIAFGVDPLISEIEPESLLRVSQWEEIITEGAF